ncbi:Uncharacterized protein APZ42_024839 [Daphnia magna]|uniref:Uncharacterized protein n=1 Tax=Daphnia magna TaxID=35525 RepID=A0A0P6CAW3_9CRUS|nr:Uncharacterized protein APZ42_024839 [Daphnia magna]
MFLLAQQVTHKTFKMVENDKKKKTVGAATKRRMYPTKKAIQFLSYLFSLLRRVNGKTTNERLIIRTPTGSIWPAQFISRQRRSKRRRTFFNHLPWQNRSKQQQKLSKRFRFRLETPPI